MSESTLDPAHMRVTYDEGALDRADLAATPLEQFRSWFEHASSDERIPEANAMVLATATASGAPSTRTVLLKGVDERGFTFYTNLGSRKSLEMTANPRVSLAFPWYVQHRQVVVCGAVVPLDRDEVREYFQSRPHESQLGAWASAQSSVIESRAGLDDAWRELHATYPPGTSVPVPDFWGGWLVQPTTIEFWQGRPSRLHDRLRYRGDGSMIDPAVWTIERLSP